MKSVTKMKRGRGKRYRRSSSEPEPPRTVTCEKSSCSWRIFLCNLSTHDTWMRVRGNPSTMTPSAYSFLSNRSSSSSSTTRSDTSNPFDRISANSSPSSEDMTMGGAEMPRADAMNGVFVPLPEPGAPPSSTISRGNTMLATPCRFTTLVHASSKMTAGSPMSCAELWTGGPSGDASCTALAAMTAAEKDEASSYTASVMVRLVCCKARTNSLKEMVPLSFSSATRNSLSILERAPLLAGSTEAPSSGGGSVPPRERYSVRSALLMTPSASMSIWLNNFRMEK
mmetsp:Transcript_13310/g.41936  ORF Transcript_13310/g.41936 Transcript_13310/m.41936 type:complete len:283 (+) Transcript_13310:1981-2829(+)